MKLLLTKLLLLLVPALAWEEHATFRQYPIEALQDEAARFDALSAAAPEALVISSLPGRQDIFAHLQPVVRRNSLLFKLQIKYVLQGGCQYDSFFGASDSERIILPPDCGTHCINRGRYCPRHGPEKLQLMAPNVNGADVVLESLKRMCLANALVDIEHESDHPAQELFFRYMKSFHDRDCMHEGYFREENATDTTVNGCSDEILQGEIFNRMPPVVKTNLENCIGDIFHDHPNDVLQDALNYNIDDLSRLPLMELNGEIIEEHTIQTEEALDAWCESFQGEKPISCQFCRKCKDVKTCLWALTCDGEEFDMATYNVTQPPTASPTVGPELILPEDEIEPEDEFEPEDEIDSNDQQSSEDHASKGQLPSHHLPYSDESDSSDILDSQDDKPNTSSQLPEQQQTQTTTTESAEDKNMNLLIAEVLAIGFLLGAVVVALIWSVSYYRYKKQEQEQDATKLLDSGFQEDTNDSLKLAMT